MLIVLSPAKTLDLVTEPHTKTYTQPELLSESEVLIKQLKRFSPPKLSELMSLSEKLADLNVSRFKDWKRPFAPSNAKQAVLMFDGDVYDGLNAKTLTPARLDWAQDHIRILSGLYGILRPLDLMQPYRLEMGTRLKTARGNNLYSFWGQQIAEHISAVLASSKDQTLVNLASDEYFQSVTKSALAPGVRIVQPVFEEPRPGHAKPWGIVSFVAKRSRGKMARYAIEKRLTRAESLKKFAVDGYRYAPEVSDDTRWVFRRCG
ncbi:MAG: peroxide stress protein YaaA [Burkholderiaceae bacterium]